MEYHAFQDFFITGKVRAQHGDNSSFQAAGRTRDTIARVSSTASKIGGWQVNPEHTTANDRPPCSAGRFGIVSAKAGGRFSATALSASNRRTAVPKPSGRTAAQYNSAATSSFPTIATRVCGWM